MNTNNPGSHAAHKINISALFKLFGQKNI